MPSIEMNSHRCKIDNGKIILNIKNDAIDNLSIPKAEFIKFYTTILLIKEKFEEDVNLTYKYCDDKIFMILKTFPHGRKLRIILANNIKKKTVDFTKDDLEDLILFLEYTNLNAREYYG